MHIPESFAARLHRDFQGRFRLRWSARWREFQLEQKLAAGQILEPPLTPEGVWDTADDDYIRARDGYWLVMSIRQGDRMPCKRCRATLKVPIRETREIRCGHCNTAHKAAFYPLDDLLLLHLRWIDPLSGGVMRMRTHERKRNRRHEKARDSECWNEVDAASSDNFNALFDIQSVGYTGKEQSCSTTKQSPDS